MSSYCGPQPDWVHFHSLGAAQSSPSRLAVPGMDWWLLTVNISFMFLLSYGPGSWKHPLAGPGCGQRWRNCPCKAPQAWIPIRSGSLRLGTMNLPHELKRLSLPREDKACPAEEQLCRVSRPICLPAKPRGPTALYHRLRLGHSKEMRSKIWILESLTSRITSLLFSVFSEGDGT